MNGKSPTGDCGWCPLSGWWFQTLLGPISHQPTIWEYNCENKKCFKPPTSYGLTCGKSPRNQLKMPGIVQKNPANIHLVFSGRNRTSFLHPSSADWMLGWNRWRCPPCISNSLLISVYLRNHQAGSDLLDSKSNVPGLFLRSKHWELPTTMEPFG